MYDNNSTIPDLNKPLEESKQGEVFFQKEMSEQEGGKKFYIESYGCAMNFSDSEIVASILSDSGFAPTKNIDVSDLILINTCSIREKAEHRVRQRLTEFAKYKKTRPGTFSWRFRLYGRTIKN